ncbi:prostaglandin F synthase [Arthrobacter sp. Hiyo1]|uniref:aldo/keto reductase n=1 Tax=Arthrobacter sp. Hiyo1 TaxID=1588020 RepID=UPI0006A3B816|nr:aldo/keto reductase [Arthrobacter sp. Hiyo1]GAP59833.1 prostaglandin F synthase [Arthrobacter sp. Hiyo1]
MSILNESYTLANGVEIPKLGLGTWFIDDDKAADAVKAAIEIGYRNIDTAQAYGNERGVGEGIRTSSVAREELFVSTKLAAEIKDYDGAVAAIDGSLEKLGLEYIDLMLIHSPQPWDDFRGGDYADGNRQAWRALEAAYRAGKVRSIGVSNFLESDLDTILSTATVVPQVNQLLVHAGNTPADLLAYCVSKGILVQAYSPIAHGEMLKNTEVRAIAGRYGVTVPQLCIRYTLQLGTVSLPKTANPEHMRSNAEVDFVIADDDMAALRKLQDMDYGEHTAFPVYGGKRHRRTMKDDGLDSAAA